MEQGPAEEGGPAEEAAGRGSIFSYTEKRAGGSTPSWEEVGVRGQHVTPSCEYMGVRGALFSTGGGGRKVSI